MVEKNNIFDRLPDNIRDIFTVLYNDVIWLQQEEKLYRELFGNIKSTRLLCEISFQAFTLIQYALKNDMFLSICRISEKYETFGHTNLSLATLAEFYPKFKKPSEYFIKLCEPVKTLRDKKIGHSDLNTQILPMENLFPEITFEQIENILDFASKYLLEFYDQFDKGGLAFSYRDLSGSKALMYWLQKAKGITDN